MLPKNTGLPAKKEPMGYTPVHLTPGRCSWHWSTFPKGASPTPTPGRPLPLLLHSPPISLTQDWDSHASRKDPFLEGRTGTLLATAVFIPPHTMFPYTCPYSIPIGTYAQHSICGNVTPVTAFPDVMSAAQQARQHASQPQEPCPPVV